VTQMVNQPNQSGVAPVDATFRDDEINLFDLVKDLQQEKVWIFASVMGLLLLAFAYLFVSTPVYLLESQIKPVTEKHLVEVNQPQLEGIFKLDVEGAFASAKYGVFSNENRKQFYLEHLDALKEKGFYDTLLTQEQNFAGFDKKLSASVSNDKKDVEIYMAISFESQDPEFGAQLLNDFVVFALEQRLTDVKDTISSKIEARIKQLEFDASLKREKYYTDKTRRQLQLSEALGIAKDVGQEKPLYADSDILGSFAPPLYMYGSKVLAAEERALSERSEKVQSYPLGEDHFIKGLPEILFEIKELKSLNIDYSSVQLALVDKTALVPNKPIKPKKVLILALAMVAGLFVGLMIALVVAAYKRYQTGDTK